VPHEVVVRVRGAESHHGAGDQQHQPPGHRAERDAAAGLPIGEQQPRGHGPAGDEDGQHRGEVERHLTHHPHRHGHDDEGEHEERCPEVLAETTVRGA